MGSLQGAPGVRAPDSRWSLETVSGGFFGSRTNLGDRTIGAVGFEVACSSFGILERFVFGRLGGVSFLPNVFQSIAGRGLGGGEGVCWADQTTVSMADHTRPISLCLFTCSLLPPSPSLLKPSKRSLAATDWMLREG